MTTPRDRGVERTTFRDAATGRNVVQWTNNALWESRHAYYDHCPWSYDGRYIAFASARSAEVKVPERDGFACSNAQVCVMDCATGAIRTVVEPVPYFTHTGAFTLWHPRQNRIFYRSSAGQEGGQIGSVDLETGKVEHVEADMQSLDCHGRAFVIAYNRTSPRHPEAGIYVTATDGSSSTLIATKTQLYEATPNRDRFDASEMTVGNTKWSPDGEYVLAAMWVNSKPALHRSLYLIRGDGSQVRWLSYFGGHHGWTPDGKAVIHRDWLTRQADGQKSDPRLMLIDVATGKTRLVIDEPLGSHPVMHPQGHLVFDWDEAGVYAVNIPRQRYEYLVRFRQAFDQSHAGTHPHAVLSRDGASLLYASAETGHAELYTVSIAEER